MVHGAGQSLGRNGDCNVSGVAVFAARANHKSRLERDIACRRGLNDVGFRLGPNFVGPGDRLANGFDARISRDHELIADAAMAIVRSIFSNTNGRWTIGLASDGVALDDAR